MTPLIPHSIRFQPHIEDQNFLNQCIEALKTLAQKIYAFVLSVFNYIFCCPLSAPLPALEYTDPVSRLLAGAHNPSVQGQIYGVYITTNESHLGETFEFFRQHPAQGAQGRIHIGCASWFNLDVIAARRSQYGLIVDFNPKNLQFIQKTIELVRVSPTRQAFIAMMREYLGSLRGAERDTFFHADQRGSPLDRIEQELAREGSWLFSDESYLYIKNEIVGRDRLIAITEDIRNFDTFSRVREILNQNQIGIDTLYLSNTSNFMTSLEDQAHFEASLRHLLQEETTFINCPRILEGGQRIILQQQALRGREVLSNNFNLSTLYEIRRL
jgi:hypothetical protein